MILINGNKSRGSRYLYEKIYDTIKQNILNRKMNPNEKLPSKRQLATLLEVSVNTITNAYEQLIAEGYIYTIERSGYYVENITQFTHKETTKNTLPNDLNEVYESKEDWVSLSHMTADISMFPFKEWIKCQQQAITNHETELAEITHLQGPYIVRETISRIIALSRGVTCKPEQIVISAGTQLLIQQLMEMQKKNTVVALEDPGYPRFYSLLSRMNIHVEPIELDEEGINIQKIEAANANFSFVTPSHQYPTGKIMPISRRIELLNWSTEANDRFIVEDDYDSEFKYKTGSIPSLQSLDRNDRVIYTGTFSKSLLPGLRISYMVLPADVLRDYQNYYSDLIQYSNTLALFTLHYFIESGAYARHIRRMNHHYETKRQLLIDQLTERFQEDIIIEDIPAGLHFVAQFNTNREYAEIEARAKQQKLEVYSMKRFMLKHKHKEINIIQLIIGFAKIPIDQIPIAVDKLYQIMTNK